jgi:hypothetical protein
MVIEANVPRKKRLAQNTAIVRELLVSATEEELNQALREHRIQPDRILSIMLEPGTQIAGGSGPRYRVIYRA